MPLEEDVDAPESGEHMADVPVVGGWVGSAGKSVRL
jgi:hypothetical protein